jgi:hypothetical protein
MLSCWHRDPLDAHQKTAHCSAVTDKADHIAWAAEAIYAEQHAHDRDHIGRDAAVEIPITPR